MWSLHEHIYYQILATRVGWIFLEQINIGGHTEMCKGLSSILAFKQKRRNSSSLTTYILVIHVCLTCSFLLKWECPPPPPPPHTQFLPFGAIDLHLPTTLVLADTVCHVGLWNEVGHPACSHKWYISRFPWWVPAEYKWTPKDVTLRIMTVDFVHWNVNIEID